MQPGRPGPHWKIFPFAVYNVDGSNADALSMNLVPFCSEATLRTTRLRRLYKPEYHAYARHKAQALYSMTQTTVETLAPGDGLAWAASGAPIPLLEAASHHMPWLSVPTSGAGVAPAPLGLSSCESSAAVCQGAMPRPRPTLVTSSRRALYSRGTISIRSSHSCQTDRLIPVFGTDEGVEERENIIFSHGQNKRARMKWSQ